MTCQRGDHYSTHNDGLLFKTLHTLSELHLVLGELDKVLVAFLEVQTMMPQTSVMSVELLLDNGVPLPQVVNQSLVV